MRSIQLFPPWRKNNADEVIRDVLDSVKRMLTEINRREIRRLGHVTSAPQQLEYAFVSIRTVRHVSDSITLIQTSAPKLQPDEVVDQLEELAIDVERTIASQERCPQSAFAGAVLHEVAGLLHGAEARIIPLFDQQLPTTVRNVLVPSDMLYQTHRSLFPPERMLVVAGHQCGAGIMRLGATFDVTGNGPDTHHGHVRADPEKLGRALIAMDLSGTELGAWVHSHPGRGPAATTPSPIDRDQHQDWIRDYSDSLLSIIMADDGYIRFWGSAVESGQLALRIVGPGVTEEETHVYRLAQG